VLLDPNPWDVRVGCEGAMLPDRKHPIYYYLNEETLLVSICVVWVLRVLRLPHHSSTPAILREALL
jgi:hypothetical protein